MGMKQSKYIHIINENMYPISIIEDTSNIIPLIDKIFLNISNKSIQFYHENNYIITINWIKVNKWGFSNNIFKFLFNISNNEFLIKFNCQKCDELSNKMIIKTSKLNDNVKPS